MRFAKTDSAPEGMGLLMGDDFYQKEIVVLGDGFCLVQPELHSYSITVPEDVAAQLVDRRIRINVYVERKERDANGEGFD